MITTQIFETDIEPLLHRGQVLIGGAYHTRDNGMKAKIDRRILWCIRHATASLPTDRMWTAVHIWTTRSGCVTLCKESHPCSLRDLTFSCEDRVPFFSRVIA